MGKKKSEKKQMEAKKERFKREIKSWEKKTKRSRTEGSRCDVPDAERIDVYSRGLMVPAILLRQWTNSNANGSVVPSYQFETETIDLSVNTHSYCYCDGKGKCEGDIYVVVGLASSGRTADRNLGSVLFPIGKPFGPMTPFRRAKPTGARSLAFHLDTTLVKVPKQGGRFSELLPGAGLYMATAGVDIPCTPGRYARRFAVVRENPYSGKKISPGIGAPDHVVLVEVHLVVTASESEQCAATVSIVDTFMVEFEDLFDHTFGGTMTGNSGELPDITPNYPRRGPRPTKNLLRRIKADGRAVGIPFPARR